jgi:DNA-binding CsgD family transcriptional regulator
MIDSRSRHSLTHFGPPAPRCTPTLDLTPMQLRVVEYVARGASYKTIGRELNMSRHTARAHVNAVAGKLPNTHDVTAYRLVQAWVIARDFEENTLRDSA